MVRRELRLSRARADGFGVASCVGIRAKVTPHISCRGEALQRDNRGMKIMYTPRNCAGPEYEIEADRHGNYTIKLNGKVVRRVSALPNYLGKPLWGSKKLEADAIEDAMRDIDASGVQAA
jgi:hypothetical protein